MKKKNSVTSIERDHYIDIIRGLCILGIIWHHTCLYAGGDFVPYFMKQLSFLLEVPAIFFVSGMTYQYIQRDMIVGGVLKLALTFTFMGILLNILDGNFDFNANLAMIIQSLLCDSFIVPPIYSVLDGSYWFVPIYITVLIFATIVMQKFKPIYPLVMLSCLIPYILAYSGHLNLDLLNFSTHWGRGSLAMAFFFLFGYWCREKLIFKSYQRKAALFILLSAIVAYLCFYMIDGSAVCDLLKSKDLRVGLPYIVASMFCICLIVFFYRSDRKNLFLEHIGKYSIFYYICSGITTSYLKFLEPHLQMMWSIRLIVIFMVNVLACILCSEIYIAMYEGCGRLYQRAVTLVVHQK